MASAAQDRLYEIFVEIAGKQASNLSLVTDAGKELAGSLKDVVAQIHATVAAPAPAKASTAAPPAPQSTGGGVLDALESAGSTVLKNALGAAPLIRGIISLFGGGDSPAPLPALVKYALPPSIQFAAAETQTGFSAVDYDQTGMPRVFGREAAATPAQVTVNVQAMDARSFLDRSTEIAAAVRDAMLNLNSINDVVNDL